MWILSADRVLNSKLEQGLSWTIFVRVSSSFSACTIMHWEARMGHGIGGHLPIGKAVLPLKSTTSNPNYRSSLLTLNIAKNMVHCGLVFSPLQHGQITLDYGTHSLHTSPAVRSGTLTHISYLSVICVNRCSIRNKLAH